MKRRKTPEDALMRKLKNLNEATGAMKKYAAVVPLLSLSSGDLVDHDLKEMGKAQDEYLRANDALFKEEQHSAEEEA